MNQTNPAPAIEPGHPCASVCIRGQFFSPPPARLHSRSSATKRTQEGTITCRIIILLLAATTLLTSIQAQPPDRVITEGLIDAPVAEVWKAFTTKEGIESWMVAKTEFELRIGATWRTSYSRDSTLDDGQSIHHTILAFDPERMLAFRTIKAPDGSPFGEEITKAWTVVYFEPAGNQTRVVTHMLGFTASEASQTMRGFFEQGNQETMDALVARFKQ